MPPKNKTADPEEERECRVRQKPVKGQSRVFEGLGVLGKENGVVLIVAKTFKGGGTASGRAARAVVFDHIPGASLHHIPGFEKCVSTADHCLEMVIEDFMEKRKVYWQLEVWAMIANQFDGLTNEVRWDLHALVEKGAVRAEGYFSLAEDRKYRDEDDGVPCGLDVTVVKLFGPLTGLSAAPNQPHVLFRKEAGNVSSYFTSSPLLHFNGVARKLELMLEGIGTSTSVQMKKSQRQKKKNKRLQNKEKPVTSVTWTELGPIIRWTRTTITGMEPWRFGVGIYLASWKVLPFKHSGELRISEAYIPKGFSGGGAYANLPARALNPNARANDADIPVLLGNIACWEYSSGDTFSSKVIYGQRNCRRLSAIYFLFSSLLTDLEGKLIGEEDELTIFEDEDDDEDEDAPFWFIEFLVDAYLLDRRYDDVLLTEGEGARGGDLEEKGIYGQRSCRMLSIICFYFSPLFAALKEGGLQDDGDGKEVEDEDTPFGFIRFLASAILLDRRGDDVLLIEKEGGGDFEKGFIHSTTVALLTREGLAQQLTGDYHRF